MAGSQQHAVTATRVPDSRRLAFLPELFGTKHFVRGEALVYSYARRLSHDYDGGYWEFYALSGGSGYLAPTQPESTRVSVWSNGFQGRISADAFGIVITLFILNQLAHESADRGDDASTEFFVDQYHKLRNYAFTRPEAALIARAID